MLRTSCKGDIWDSGAGAADAKAATRAKTAAWEKIIVKVVLPKKRLVGCGKAVDLFLSEDSNFLTFIYTTLATKALPPLDGLADYAMCVESKGHGSAIETKDRTKDRYMHAGEHDY